MKVTRGDPAGAIHFKPFAQWELHDGAASDGSVKTEALHSPSGAHTPTAPNCHPWQLSPNCQTQLMLQLPNWSNHPPIPPH